MMIAVFVRNQKRRDSKRTVSNIRWRTDFSGSGLGKFLEAPNGLKTLEDSLGLLSQVFLSGGHISRIRRKVRISTSKNGGLGKFSDFHWTWKVQNLEFWRILWVSLCPTVHFCGWPAMTTAEYSFRKEDQEEGHLLNSYHVFFLCSKVNQFILNLTFGIWSKYFS